MLAINESKSDMVLAVLHSSECQVIFRIIFVGYYHNAVFELG